MGDHGTRFRYGVRGHDFGRMRPGELARSISSRGFSCLQLAPSKALSEPDCGSGRLSPELARGIAREFTACGVEIAVLGCYVNPVDPDAEARRLGIERFREHLRVAADFGCPVVATETGWQDGEHDAPYDDPVATDADDGYRWPSGHTRSEESFALLAETVRGWAAEAESHGAIVAIEPVVRHTVYSPRRMKRLLDAVPSSAMGVILDPVNLLDLTNWHRQRSVMDECLDFFGDRIVAVHAKDFIVLDTRLKTVPAGSGVLDYRYFLAELAKRQPRARILLEELAPDESVAARKRLEELS